MTEMTVKRSSSDGSNATYRVTLRERTDRTLHEMTVSHGESQQLAKAFASIEELVRYVFEGLLARRAKEDIPSAFALKDLLAHEPDVARDLHERAVDPDAGIRDYLTGARSSH
jgi:hypothetical protein